jgi:hypothetical protein
MVGQAIKAVANRVTKLEDKSEDRHNAPHLGTLPGPQTFSFLPSRRTLATLQGHKVNTVSQLFEAI